jgi:hypothetical protein
LPEVDLGPDATGDGEHRSVEIDADGRAAGTNPVGGHAGDDPGAAGDVQHSLALRHTGGVAQDRRPLGKEPRHEGVLVEHGRFERYLEGLRGFGSGHVPIVRHPGELSIGQLPYSGSRTTPR